MIVEDTTSLRDKPPETVEVQKEASEQESSSTVELNGVEKAEESQKGLENPGKGQLKTSADIKSALDSFFEE